MAFVGIRVPKETCGLFSSIDVPGDKVDQSTMHITLLYLGKEVPLDQVAKAIEVTAKLCQETEHFEVSTERVETFPENPDDGFPVIARIESNELHSFQKALKQAYDNADVEYSKKYPEYKPHVTLAYDKQALKSPIKFPKITFGVHELTLWGGDNNEELVSANFPFKMQQPKAAAYKLLEAARKMDPKKRALALRLVKAAEQVLAVGESGESAMDAAEARSGLEHAIAHLEFLLEETSDETLRDEANQVLQQLYASRAKLSKIVKALGSP